MISGLLLLLKLVLQVEDPTKQNLTQVKSVKFPGSITALLLKDNNTEVLLLSVIILLLLHLLVLIILLFLLLHHLLQPNHFFYSPVFPVSDLTPACASIPASKCHSLAPIPAPFCSPIRTPRSPGADPALVFLQFLFLHLLIIMLLLVIQPFPLLHLFLLFLLSPILLLLLLSPILLLLLLYPILLILPLHQVIVCTSECSVFTLNLLTFGHSLLMSCPAR